MGRWKGRKEERCRFQSKVEDAVGVFFHSETSLRGFFKLGWACSWDLLLCYAQAGREEDCRVCARGDRTTLLCGIVLGGVEPVALGSCGVVSIRR